MPRNQNTQFSIFKGGTAFNSLLKEFHHHFPKSSYIIPISDDGGSSKEICRVFGGPSIGDLRSTLTRLSDDASEETLAVKKLLEHRLIGNDEKEASNEWRLFLEDKHPLYTPLSSSYRGLIHCFLCKFEAERLQKIPCRFDLRNGSIGNFFFTGARIVLGSLETAIFVYSSVARINFETHVIPVVDSSDRLTIAAKLKGGEIILGQDAISHPSINRIVEKASWASLPSPIDQLFYVNKYGDAIEPKLNPTVIRKIKDSHCIIYGIGSFWTSIMPSLILGEVGEAISENVCPKIGLLNCCHDRETEGMTAYEYVLALTKALNRYGKLTNPPKAYLTHLLYVEGCSIPVENKLIEDLGIKVCIVPQASKAFLDIGSRRHPVYCPESLIEKISSLF